MHLRAGRMPKRLRNGFMDWLYRKFLLSTWIDLQGKEILSKSAKSRPHERVFQIIFETRTGIGYLLNSLVLERKCIVDCGSMCCYFPGKRGSGVHIKPDEADEIADFLRQHRLGKGDYIKSALGKRGRINHFLRLNKKKRMPKKMLASATKLLSGESMWIDGDSLACMFLKNNNRCMIYEKRLRACRDFICRTGNMANALFTLGVIPPSYIDGCSIACLNKLSERFMLVFSDERMRRLDAKITTAFMQMVKYYLKSDSRMNSKMTELLELGSEYDDLRCDILKI
ncbi:MAG: YkgJ family cysteine cluster protein [Candidatus Altiarchaeota archaeon]|nr:YkgJ family cysteine cluster protein [Candidatus Altiarchaeota archaeon]